MRIINTMLRNLAYYALLAVWYLLSLLPLRVLYVLSDFFYLLLAYVVKYRKRTILNNISSAFPEKTSDEHRAIVRKFYSAFCDYIVETIKLMTMSRKQMMRRMRFDGMEEINQILAEGQSVALYLSHTFNWEWISSVPLWVPDEVVCGEIYHPLENEIFDRLFLKVRQKNMAHGVAMNDTLRKIAQWKSEKRTYVMGYLSDQKPHWHNIHHWVDFLNHDTPVLTGAERIAKATNEAVAYGDIYRERRGHYVCTIKLMTRNVKDIPNWEVTDWYYKELEKTIRRQPEMWLWSHKRWKRTREEFNRRFKVENGKVVDRE